MLYLLLLYIVIWRHIHARPNVYHARLRDHVQEVDHITCVHKSGLYRNTIFMLRRGDKTMSTHPFCIYCWLPTSRRARTPEVISSILGEAAQFCALYILRVPTSVSSTGNNRARVPAAGSAEISDVLGNFCCSGASIAPSLCGVTCAMTVRRAKKTLHRSDLVHVGL